MDKETVRIITDLKRFNSKLKKKYEIQSMFLFGSTASGNRKKYSDIDLLVVSKRFRNKSVLKRSVPFYHEWHVVQNLNYPVDFICYTPEEFDDLKDRVTIVREAVRNGIEITA